MALIKALIRAAIWLDADDNANRAKAVEILARPEYVGADSEVLANSMTGTFEYERGDKRSVPDFNVFFRYYATYPYYSDAVWYLTQMRRWGQITDAKPDAWYADTARTRVSTRHLPEGRAAARRGRPRARAGLPVDAATAIARRRPSSSTASPTTATQPNAYLASFADRPPGQGRAGAVGTQQGDSS